MRPGAVFGLNDESCSGAAHLYTLPVQTRTDPSCRYELAVTAREAAETAQRVLEMRESDRERVMIAQGGGHELRLTDSLYRQPVVNAAWVGGHLVVATATVNKVLQRCEAAGALRETTGKQRGRLFPYDAYLDLFDAPAAAIEDEAMQAG
jgi:cell filamentation protein, protein adenylyltransferase